MGALFVAAVLWVPTAFVLMVTRSPLFDGMGLFGALGPVLALLVPAIANGERGASVFKWAFALAPLLMVLGSFVTFVVQRAVFGNTYTPLAANVGPLVALALWSIPGWFVHQALAPRDGRSDDRDA